MSGGDLGHFRRATPAEPEARSEGDAGPGGCDVALASRFGLRRTPLADTALTIVIPSHNRPDLLRLCLLSVRRHAPAGTQVIVVDDGSANSVISAVADEFEVTLLRNHRPLGFAAAANRGIAAATGSVIELLNDDTEVEPGWADAALARFAVRTVAAVAPLVLQGPPKAGTPVIDSAGDEYDLGGFARKRGHGEPLTDRFREPCEVFGASASSAFYRADVLRAVGGFPADFGAYFEDVDLSFRLRRVGTIVFEPASVVLHHGGQSYRRVDRRLFSRFSKIGI